MDTNVLADIKDRLELKSYIERTVPLKRAGALFKGKCPFHAGGQEKSPSLFVYPDKQNWRCYGCHRHGDLYSFIREKNGCSFVEAVEIAAEAAGVTLDSYASRQGSRYARLYSLLADCAKFYTDQREPVMKYLTGRGLTPETITAFQLGYSPNGPALLKALRELGYADDELLQSGMAQRQEGTGKLLMRFWGRLMIPICDGRGRVVGFSGRTLDPHDQPKYLNSPETPLFHKAKLLYGLDRAHRNMRQAGAAVVVEGYMDVIAAHQAGFTNVVAQMGSALSADQIALLAPRYTNRIILALDGDPAGQSAAKRTLLGATELLRLDSYALDMRVAVLPEGSDPDDVLLADPAQWETIIEQASRAEDFIIASIPTPEPGASIEERKALARPLLPLLNSEDDLTRLNRMQHLGERLGLPPNEFSTWALQQLVTPLRLVEKQPALPKPSQAYFVNTRVEQQLLVSFWRDPDQVVLIEDFLGKVIGGPVASADLFAVPEHPFWLDCVRQQPGGEMLPDWDNGLCRLLAADHREANTTRLSLMLLLDKIRREIMTANQTLQNADEGQKELLRSLADLGRQRVAAERELRRWA